MNKLISHKKMDSLCEELNHLPQVDCPTKSYFADGLYGREMLIPAGTAIVGAVHKKQGFNILMQGKIIIANEQGEATTFTAPQVFITDKGSQKAGIAVTDVVFMNVFNSTSTTEEEAATELTTSNLDELIGGNSNKQLIQNRKELN